MPTAQSAVHPSSKPPPQEALSRKADHHKEQAVLPQRLTVFLLAGLAYRLLDETNASPPDDSIWVLLPAAAVSVATLMAAVYGALRRRLQFALELAACVGLWVVLLVAR